MASESNIACQRRESSASLMSSLEHESDDLWKEHRLIAMATLTVPVWLSGLLLTATAVWQGADVASRLVFATIASLAAGRFIIWGGDPAASASGLSPLELALLVLYMDTIWAMVLTWHAGVLFHLPRIGQQLKTAVREGTALIRSNRWMRRLTVLAVLAFVMLPVSSTGSIGGSLLGRLLGLSRVATFAIVVIGSVLGGAVMLLGAELLEPWLATAGPAARWLGVGVVAVVLVILGRRYRRADG